MLHFNFSLHRGQRASLRRRGRKDGAALARREGGAAEAAAEAAETAEEEGQEAAETGAGAAEAAEGDAAAEEAVHGNGQK